MSESCIVLFCFSAFCDLNELMMPLIYTEYLAIWALENRSADVAGRGMAQA